MDRFMVAIVLLFLPSINLQVWVNPIPSFARLTSEDGSLIDVDCTYDSHILEFRGPQGKTLKLELFINSTWYEFPVQSPEPGHNPCGEYWLKPNRLEIPEIPTKGLSKLFKLRRT